MPPHRLSLLLPALLLAASLSACAQPAAPGGPGAGAKAPAAAGTPEANARAALTSIAPSVVIDHVGPAPVPGFQETVVNGQTIYVSDDGRYLLQGALFDVTARRDLSQATLARVRRGVLDGIPAKDRIVFAPPTPKYTVTVFTDVECGYCRRLHQDIAQYNARGIAVEYVAYPRMGPGSEDFAKMEAVWCSADRRKALTDAKDGRNVPRRACTSPVMMQYEAGRRVGLTGTPMIITEAGQVMPGYMPPDELRAALDRLAAEAPNVPPGTAGSR